MFRKQISTVPHFAMIKISLNTIPKMEHNKIVHMDFLNPIHCKLNLHYINLETLVHFNFGCKLKIGNSKQQDLYVFFKNNSYFGGKKYIK